MEKYNFFHKKIIGRYKNFLKEGPWLYLSMKGDTLMFENYAGGQLDGKFFSRRYQTEVSGTYNMGRKILEWKYKSVYPPVDSLCNYSLEDSSTYNYNVIKKK